MRIEDIDPNLKIETDINEPDLVWLDAKSAAFSLYGISYNEEKGVQTLEDVISLSPAPLSIVLPNALVATTLNS